MKNEDDFDMILLFQTIQHEDILSTMKIAVISPFIKIKFYTDIYEEIMRMLFENFAEARTVISKGTRKMRE